ncbi:MAG TPA: mismatch-specific DNA-glycosylase [Pseudoneobacillus sp.]|nr:mismatch-specific DNA-glycosylase [Pseudoneobacillus sp.]
MNPIPDHIKENLKILFVGFNPSLRSSETGHHFANPNNRFWTILHKSGLTPRKFTTDEDYLLLELDYGLTNIVARPTKTAQEITKEEYKIGKEELRRKVEAFKPNVICFVGKGVYQEYIGKKEVSWGVQINPLVSCTTEFVAPSSSGLVRMKMEDIIKIYRELSLLSK